MTAHRRIVRVMISGRVHGVGYRLWAKAAADRIGLAGWVRNTSDGRVEAVFAGPPAAVAEILAACRTGSPMAIVAAVEVEEVDESDARSAGLNVEGGKDSFIVLPDA